MTIRVSRQARAELRELCETVLRMQERYMFVNDNSQNPAVDNVTIMGAQATAKALESEIVGRATKVAHLLMQRKRGGA